MTDETRPSDQFAELKRLADEFRVKAHLANMDAKTKWDEELKPQLKKIEAKFDKAMADSGLSEEVTKLETQLRQMVDDLTD